MGKFEETKSVLMNDNARKAIHRVKPWLWATGAKTPEGKARSSRNALKHGLYTLEQRRFRAWLRLARAMRDMLEAQRDDALIAAGLKPRGRRFRSRHMPRADLFEDSLRRLLKEAVILSRAGDDSVMKWKIIDKIKRYFQGKQSDAENT